MHLVSISKFPPPSSGIHFRVPKIPLRACVSQQFFACILMYLHFVSMSRLHPSSLNNFLRSSCFNIELSLSPMCPSISCIHFASCVGFPQWPLHHFLRFYCFNTGTPRHQQLLACILSQYLNSPHPVPGQKNVHGIQPNVSAYGSGISPPPMEARSRKQVHGSKKQETELRNN